MLHMPIDLLSCEQCCNMTCRAAEGLRSATPCTRCRHSQTAVRSQLVKTIHHQLVADLPRDKGRIQLGMPGCTSANKARKPQCHSGLRGFKAGALWGLPWQHGWTLDSSATQHIAASGKPQDARNVWDLSQSAIGKYD